ncbi:DUF4105 domain-containing protein [Planctomycetota bacterium]
MNAKTGKEKWSYEDNMTHANHEMNNLTETASSDVANNECGIARSRRKWRKLKYMSVGLLLLIIIWFSIRPSNNRDWSPDQAVLAWAKINDHNTHIYNIRNFDYRSDDDYTIQYYDKDYDLNKLDRLYFVLEPFSTLGTMAHTMLSFAFNNEDFVVVSIEIRKEKGESFSAFRGMFKKYELMYVLGDERDMIKLRSNVRKDDVFLYPIKIEKEEIKKLFIDILERVNKLKERPEFYHTLFNNCTTNIADHINNIYPGQIPFSWKLLLSGYSDKLAFDLGLVDSDLPFNQLQTRFKINDRALKYAGSPDFSIKIRQFD